MAKKEPFLPWEDRYSVGIPLVDDQHKELLRLANALYDTCRQGEEFAKEGFRKATSSVVEYVKVHFSTEEKLMERINYPKMAEHKALHQEFVKKVFEEIKNFEEGKSFVPNAFVRFLKEWTLSHIALTDKALADYIRSIKKKAS